MANFVVPVDVAHHFDVVEKLDNRFALMWLDNNRVRTIKAEKQVTDASRTLLQCDTAKRGDEMAKTLICDHGKAIKPETITDVGQSNVGAIE